MAAFQPNLGSVSGVHVRGLRELQRAFALADKKLARELRLALQEAADPVRYDAAQLAGKRIRNILSPTAEVNWAAMRVGVTRSLVYVAPQERGRRSRANPKIRRPNLATLLMGRAMEPALVRNVATVERAVSRVLDTVGQAWEAAA
jgi:hypothetical protein